MYQGKSPVSPRGSIASRSGRRKSFTEPKKVEPTRKKAENFRIGFFFFSLNRVGAGRRLSPAGPPAGQFLMGPSFCTPQGLLFYLLRPSILDEKCSLLILSHLHIMVITKPPPLARPKYTTLERGTPAATRTARVLGSYTPPGHGEYACECPARSDPGRLSTQWPEPPSPQRSPR